MIRDDELIKKCQENAWLKRGGVMFKDDPFAEDDYKYSFKQNDTIEELKECLNFDAIRQGCIYKNLALINQVNGGDEWWAVKKFDDGELVAFESITTQPFIDRGEFEDLVSDIVDATKEECKKLDYRKTTSKKMKLKKGKRKPSAFNRCVGRSLKKATYRSKTQWKNEFRKAVRKCKT